MSRKTVLLIEENPASRSAIKSLLQQRGFEVTGHPSAEEAYRCNGHPYDVAVIDVRLPGQQGPAYARHLRSLHPETRIIFVTAANAVSEIGESLPGSAVLIKPVDVDFLAKLL